MWSDESLEKARVYPHPQALFKEVNVHLQPVGEASIFPHPQTPFEEPSYYPNQQTSIYPYNYDARRIRVKKIGRERECCNILSFFILIA